MTNRYKLDDYDLYDTFGFVASEGSDDFLRLPARKDPPSTEWKDGITEFDLSEPAFHPKEATLAGVIVADSEADFWSKWTPLWQLLSAPGDRIIEVVEISQSYKVFYMSQPVSKRLTKIKDETKIGYQISIQFKVIDFAEGMEPGSNGGFVEIVNQDAEVIAVVQAPGSYEVIQFSGIQDDGSGTYENSIIDNV